MQATGMGESEADNLVRMYTQEFGANLHSSIIGTIDTTKKAPGYMAQLLAGNRALWSETTNCSLKNN